MSRGRLYELEYFVCEEFPANINADLIIFIANNIPLSKEAALEKIVENSDDAFLFPPYGEMLNYVNIERKNSLTILAKEKIMTETFPSNMHRKLVKSDCRSWYPTVMKAAYSTVA